MALSSEIVPAAQYLRMSTEHQQYSISNQQDVIGQWATDHGYQVVRSFIDYGKSGVVLRHRKALSDLLHEVTSGRAVFRAVLVYDVSRWGRFQNCDEAAHYEFLCAQSGTPVQYCAEQFANDGSIASNIMKSLKRAMAGEFSRELGVKVYQSEKKAVLRGYRMGGRAGYGLRRMMVSTDGLKKTIMHTGEHKFFKTDHTILVPGPSEEVRIVREIYRRAKNQGVYSIAKWLNDRSVPYRDGRRWTPSGVDEVLRNPKYAGVNIWGRTEYRLSTARKCLEPSGWVYGPGFEKVIDEQTFYEVQALRWRKNHSDRRAILLAAKRQFSQQGFVSLNALKKRYGIHANTIHSNFGDLAAFYSEVGYNPPAIDVARRKLLLESQQIRTDLLSKIRKLCGAVADCVCLLVCSPRMYSFGPRWRVRAEDIKPRKFYLLCLRPASPLDAPMLYLLKDLKRRTSFSVYVGDPYLSKGRHLTQLSELPEILSD